MQGTGRTPKGRDWTTKYPSSKAMWTTSCSFVSTYPEEYMEVSASYTSITFLCPPVLIQGSFVLYGAHHNHIVVFFA